MISRDSVQTLIGGTAYSSDGDKIGSIGTVYLDNVSGEPAWVTVKTGLFGSNESFVPLDQAEQTDDGIRVPYDKDRVKNAPNIETDRELSEQEEDQLYAYYGLGGGTGQGYESSTTTTGTTAGTTDDLVGTTDSTYTERTEDSDRGWGAGDTGYQAASTGGTTTDTTATDTTTTGTTGDYRDRAEGYDTSGPTTDDAMTRSEERLRAGTEKVEAGRARLRKYVVTEQQQVNVPVTREEVRVEREPITDENRGQALDGPALSEEEHEVVLHEERPVVQTEAVPVERVRLSKDQVQDEQTVTADVRKEVIETEGGDTTAGTTTAGTSGYRENDDNDPSLLDKAKDKLS
jgi:uncharacterized protein (TIGR02271 family)